MVHFRLLCLMTPLGNHPLSWKSQSKGMTVWLVDSPLDRWWFASSPAPCVLRACHELSRIQLLDHFQCGQLNLMVRRWDKGSMGSFMAGFWNGDIMGEWDANHCIHVEIRSMKSIWKSYHFFMNLGGFPKKLMFWHLNRTFQLNLNSLGS